jgi:hypothetical protein
MKKLVLLVLIIISCNNGKKSLSDNSTVIDSKETASDILIEQYMLDDTINYSDFNITFNNNYEDIYSSSDSVFKRRYNGRFRTAKFGLTRDDKRLIYNLVKKIDFFSLPEEIIEDKSGECVLPSPSTEISVNIGSKYNKVYYSGECNIKDQIIAIRFERMDSLLSYLIYNKEDVKLLEPSDLIYE